MADLLRWLDLCRRANAQGDFEAVYARLAAAYGEPSRAYHTLDHVAFCLDELGPARHLAAYPEEVEMALWFHDAVYVPCAADNEARSAELARAACRELKLHKAFGKRVFHHVIATQHHATPPTVDGQLVADADLAILGHPQAAFDAYERGVRQEHAAVAEAEFRPGRAAVLRALLARPVLYATEPFRVRYEAAARANLERSLRRLATLP